MNEQEHLLTVLSEECAEVTQAVSKALRFGLNDIGPKTLNTNAQNIEHEFIEAMAVRDMLRELGVIEEPENLQRIYEYKRQRVKRFIEYARSKGTVT